MNLSVLVVLLLAGSVQAGELCFDRPDGFEGCPGGDLGMMFEWVGYSTDSTGCGYDPAGHGYEYLRLSLSDEDPFANVGPLPGDGKVYFWINLPYSYATAAYGPGMTINATVVGDLDIESYEPISEGRHIWEPGTGELYFHICDPVPELVGAFVIRTTAVDGSTWGRVKALWR